LDALPRWLLWYQIGKSSFQPLIDSPAAQSVTGYSWRCKKLHSRWRPFLWLLKHGVMVVSRAARSTIAWSVQMGDRLMIIDYFKDQIINCFMKSKMLLVNCLVISKVNEFALHVHVLCSNCDKRFSWMHQQKECYVSRGGWSIYKTKSFYVLKVF
jgi:hypothetical protein